MDTTSMKAQCEAHPDVPTWRSDGLGPVAKKTHIGCWRCHLHRAKDGPPEKQGSARGELALTLALVKGKPAREEAVAEVLTLLMKELRQAQGERELLKKRVEGLTLENRDVGGRWQSAVARSKELETQVEKLEAQMDKTLGVMDELEKEKEEAGAKASKVEAQVKQVEKERDGLKADAADLATRVKELESQLQAVLEQKRLSSTNARGSIFSSSSSSSVAGAPAPVFAPAAIESSSTTSNKSPTLLTQPSQSQAKAATATTATATAPAPTEPAAAAPSSPVLGATAAVTDEQGDPYAEPSAALALASSVQPQQQEKREEGPEGRESMQQQPEQQQQQQQQQLREPRGSIQFPNVFKGLAFGKGGGGHGKDKEGEEEAGVTAAGGVACGGKPKITLTVHMAGQHRVNFTTYRTDRFEKVMDKYLQVKKIAAARDEVKFVVDTVHHTLAPELTPDDFALEDGATINVIVPSEPLEGADGEAEEAQEVV